MARKSLLVGVLTLVTWTGLLIVTDAGAQTEVITTAPDPVRESAAATTPVTTGVQISAWGREDDDGLIGSGAGDLARPQFRTVHGEVTAGVGSGGFREVSGVADLPVGDTGDLVVAGSRSSFDGRGSRGGRQSLSVGLFLNGSNPCLPDRRDPNAEVGEPSQAASASPARDAALRSCSVAEARPAPPD